MLYINLERGKYIMSVDVQRVKTFNDELKRYVEKANKNAAEIEFNNREIKRICDELTTELGIEVTPENIATIAEERIAKIENTLQAGEAIIERIRQEEEAEASNEALGANTMVTDTNAGGHPNATPQAQQVYQQPVQQVQNQQGYQIDQFNQPVQQAPQGVTQGVPQAMPQMQGVQQGVPQMQGYANVPNMGGFPIFQVGNKPQQSQAVPAQEIGEVNLFNSGAGAVEI